jgi:uncharacterized protein YecT (DUF1311 family)
MRKAALFMFSLAWASFAAGNCDQAQSTLELSGCKKVHLDKADAKLNKIYKKVLAEYSLPDDESITRSEVRKRLLAAQKAWITFRDNDCEARYTIDASGSIRILSYLDCMIDKTEKRTVELEQYVNP